ncbi:MAG TPA: carboxypeptidase regulatory-like domain-containing protein [Longimicrobium sp.]|nr:carboxypeptidase regulatory-like domain-containing protein [Longimicrobium sp.]
MFAHRSTWLAFLTVAALSAVSPAGAQTTPLLHGTVTDAGTGQPIAHALVSVDTRGKRTNDQGRFAHCNLPATTVQLVVEARGYQPDTTSVQLSPDVPVDVRVALEPGTGSSVSTHLAPPLNRTLKLDQGLYNPSRLPFRRHPRRGPERPLPLYFVNGERVFVLGGYDCHPPPPGIRIIPAPEADDIEEIHVVREDEARERFGPEGEHGALFITTRAGVRP